MKYTININQKELSNTNLDLVDAAILDYLRVLCGSTHPKIVNQRDGDYTWADYGKIISDNPMLKINSRGAITKRINNIKEAGYIKTKMRLKNGHRLIYVKLTPKMDSLFIEMNGEPIHENEKPIHENELISNTKDKNTITEASSEKVSKPKLKDPQRVQKLIDFSVKRRGGDFADCNKGYCKQKKAFLEAQELGITIEQMREKWLSYEKDKFWKEKDFDWMNVFKGFNKIIKK